MTDFDTLRRRIIQKDHDPLEKYNETVVFSEDCSEDKMCLTMTLPGDFWCIKKMDEKFEPLKKILKKKKCADAVIWEPVDSSRWRLHVIEMKKTVSKSNGSTWEHIKTQFVGAYRLCKMVAAALDIEFEQVVFYTAFVHDKISSHDNSDTGDTEDPISLVPDPDMPDDMQSPGIEWKSGKCQLHDSGWSVNYCNREYVHTRIKMDESSDGTYIATVAIQQ